MNLKTLARSAITKRDANHVVLSIDDYVALYSYNSLIAVVEPSGQVLLGEDWQFSKTTSKFRSQFLGESTADTEAKLISGEYKLLEELLCKM